MTRVLLGALVASMLTLTGLVTYHSFTWSDNPAVTGPVPTGGGNSCVGVCTLPSPQGACCDGEAAAKKSACCEDAAPAAAGAKEERPAARE